MRPRMRIMLLVALPCLLFSLSADAVAQVGRLAGTVAYYAPGARPVAARGVRVIAVGSYARSETRTDNNGSFVLVLRAGGYNVVAQGAYGFVQVQEVRGYVAPNTDSYISPNPLYLVQGGRSSGSMTTLPLSRTATRNERETGEHQNGLTLEAAAENSDGAETGDLVGSVIYKQTNTPAYNVEVEAVGPHGRRPARTGRNGVFVMKSIKVGRYEIYVRPPAGFKQEVVVIAYVVKGRNESVSPTLMLIPK